MLGQNGRYHGRSNARRFRFCCLILDARARKRFLNDSARDFWRKGAPTLNLENYWQTTFLHVWIKLEGRSRTNALSRISSMHCASYNYIGCSLTHLKVVPQIPFLKITFMKALRGETTRKLESSESIWKIVTAPSKKTTYGWTYSMIKKELLSKSPVVGMVLLDLDPV